MLTTEQINDLHRLYWSEHWPIRKIERQLNIGASKVVMAAALFPAPLCLSGTQCR